jgi:hypothetical protein
MRLFYTECESCIFYAVFKDFFSLGNFVLLFVKKLIPTQRTESKNILKKPRIEHMRSRDIRNQCGIQETGEGVKRRRNERNYNVSWMAQTQLLFWNLFCMTVKSCLLRRRNKINKKSIENIDIWTMLWTWIRKVPCSNLNIVMGYPELNCS